MAVMLTITLMTVIPRSAAMYSGVWGGIGLVSAPILANFVELKVYVVSIICSESDSLASK